MARNSTRDRIRFDILRDGPVIADLGPEEDDLVVRARDDVVDQVRLTIIRGEVGNGNPNEGTAPGQDGGLAVRLQAEDAAGTAFGPISRFDDEGTIFRSHSRDVKFDVRDTPLGSVGLFDVVALGTAAADDYDFRGGREDHYVNSGAGDDRVVGGRGNDYLIGAAGNDLVRGRGGDDILVGGPGDDRLEGGAGNDRVIYRPAFDGANSVDLGSGDDVVEIFSAPREIRITWSTLQTGNGDPNDSGVLANEDGGLNVRLQSEDSAGNLIGPVSRYDDEGISFVGSPGVTFELRDLPSGVVRDSGIGIVRLGSSGDDVYDDSAATVDVFHNGGMGNDRLTGGSGADHLVGLDGNDRLEGGLGDDLLVGLGGADTFVFAGVTGRDTILTYQPGTDRIDLSAYGIGLANVTATQTGPNTLVQVDSDEDGDFDFEIFLGGSAPPADTDYLF